MPIIKNLRNFSNIKMGSLPPLYGYTLTNRVGLFDYGLSFTVYQTAISGDGCIYVCGTFYDGPRSQNHSYLIKCDTNLNVVKQIHIEIDGSKTDSIVGLKVDQNGNLFVVGTSMATSDNLLNAFIMKFDADLNKIGEKMFDGGVAIRLQFSAMAVDSNGDIYITGTQIDQIDGNYNGIVFKLDNDLNVLRDYSYGLDGYRENFYDVALDAQGHIYVCGSTNNANRGVVMKLDSDLSIMDQVIISNTDNTWLYGLRLDSQNNVIVCGRHQSDGDINGIIVKLDSNLNMIGAVEFDGAVSTDHVFAMSCCINSNDEIYVGGYTRADSNNDSLIVKLDPDLNEIAQKSFDKGDYDYIFDVQIDDQDNLIVAGRIHDTYEKGFVLVNTDGLVTLPSSIAGISISDTGTTVSSITPTVTSANMVRAPSGSIVITPAVTITDLTSTAHTVHPY